MTGGTISDNVVLSAVYGADSSVAAYGSPGVESMVEAICCVCVPNESSRTKQSKNLDQRV